MSDWIDIAALEAVPLRGARIVKTALGCVAVFRTCLLYTSPSPRDRQKSRMPSSA